MNETESSNSTTQYKFISTKDITGSSGILGISASNWYEGLKSGRYDVTPIKLGPRTVRYRLRDIEALILRCEGGSL